MNKDQPYNPDALSSSDMAVFQETNAFSEIKALQLIQQPTPENWIKILDKGKMKLSYVSGDTVTRMLNKAFNYKWSFYIMETRVVPSEDKPAYKGQGSPTPQGPVVQVHGRLIVPGWGVREQWGSQSIIGGQDTQEHAFKGAATDAMKKCASMFGIALDLYGTDGLTELMTGPADLLADDEAFLDRLREKKQKTKDEDKEDVKIKPESAEPANVPPAEPDMNQVDDSGDVIDIKPEEVPVPKHKQAPVEPVTPAPVVEYSSAQDGAWKKEDIDALKEQKTRLNIVNNKELDVYAKEFFGNDDATYQSINPYNIKDFAHFLSAK